MCRPEDGFCYNFAIEAENKDADERTARVQRWWFIALAAACVVGFLVVALPYSGRCLDDDAFITFRYAENFLDGHGVVYNPGERVEGYTNFLWLMLNAGAMALGADPAISSQGFGLLFGTGTVLLLFVLGWRRDRSWRALWAPAALIAVLPYSVECLLGLEMPLFIFLVVAGIGLYARESGPRDAVLTAAAFALATMTRPEGAALFGLTVASDLLRHGWKNMPWRTVFARCLGFAVIYGPYYAWRYSYYGYPFPNTFYAKTGGGTLMLGVGFDYVSGALLRIGPLALLGLLLLWRRRSPPAWAVLCGLVIAFYLVYLIWIGGDFRFHYRFFIPVLPPLFLLAAEGARQFIAHPSLADRPRVRAAAWLVVAAMIAFASLRTAEPAQRWAKYREQRNPRLFAIGYFLKTVGPPDALIAISGGGIVPYVSGMPAIEMWGLTDVHIAHQKPRPIGRGVPGHLKGDGAYILERKPRYILFIATMWTRRVPTRDEIGARVAAPSEIDLWRDERFFTRYEPRAAPLPIGGVVNFFELKPEYR